jgi:hypothetical protein
VHYSVFDVLIGWRQIASHIVTRRMSPVNPPTLRCNHSLSLAKKQIQEQNSLLYAWHCTVKQSFVCTQLNVVQPCTCWRLKACETQVTLQATVQETYQIWNRRDFRWPSSLLTSMFSVLREIWPLSFVLCPHFISPMEVMFRNLVSATHEV